MNTGGVAAGAIVGPRGQNRTCHLVAEANASLDPLARPELGQRRLEERVDRRLLARKQRVEGGPGRGGGSGVRGGAARTTRSTSRGRPPPRIPLTASYTAIWVIASVRVG